MHIDTYTYKDNQMTRTHRNKNAKILFEKQKIPTVQNIYYSNKNKTHLSQRPTDKYEYIFSNAINSLE